MKKLIILRIAFSSHTQINELMGWPGYMHGNLKLVGKCCSSLLLMQQIYNDNFPI